MAQTSTDPLVSLIREAAATPVTPTKPSTYGTPTTEAGLNPMQGRYGPNANGPPSVADTTWFESVPYAEANADPAGPGGALDVLSMVQVAGAPGQAPISVFSYPVRGSVEYP